MELEKHCPDCGHSLPLSAFTRDKRRRDGLAFYCKDHARQRLRASKARRQGPPKRRYPLDRVVADGMQWCPDCDIVKPLVEFPASRSRGSGRHIYCKPCHNARRRATLERVGGSRTYHLKRRYGLTAEEADTLLDQQSGLCAIYQAAPAVHVDHDHATGAVRALLCFNCNGGLGQFKDNPELLHAAAYYVQFHTIRQQMVAELELACGGPEVAPRPGDPPVGSQRGPGTRGTSSRRTGRTSGPRRETSAGEADT